jgi:hypothetical protein
MARASAASPGKAIGRVNGELAALARAQGVRPAKDWRKLRGDFWPEDETCDEFIAAIREWRREGGMKAPRP